MKIFGCFPLEDEILGDSIETPPDDAKKRGA